MTSIGCHTMLWNFSKNEYHKWVKSESIENVLAPIKNGDEVAGHYKKNIPVGVGLHDSSAALIPYLTSFNEPFVLISTGTWCISMNPFNDQVITEEELKQDVLCYMTYQGKPIKASRLFAGNEHEIQTKRLAAFFSNPNDHYKSIKFDLKHVSSELGINQKNLAGDLEFAFSDVDLSVFSNYESAYYALIESLILLQVKSTNLVLKNSPVKKIFVDGGFGKNSVFMGMLAKCYPDIEIYSSVVAQASALGAAMAIHNSWNASVLPTKIIELKRH
jgi:sugar (pentulose or hexulose) kinase